MVTQQTNLINLSIMPSTHICIRMKLNPYLHSMHMKFTMNQSLSSKVSSFPSNIASLEDTSARGDRPDQRVWHMQGYTESIQFCILEKNIIRKAWEGSEYWPSLSRKCFMCRLRGWIMDPPVSYSYPPMFSVARRPPTVPASNTSIFTAGPNSCLKKNAAAVPPIPPPIIAEEQMHI